MSADANRLLSKHNEPVAGTYKGAIHLGTGEELHCEQERGQELRQSKT